MEFLIALIAFWFLGRKKDTQSNLTRIPSYESEEPFHLSLMNPREFELYCASWLQRYGYECQVTRYVGDGNVDILVKDSWGNLVGIGECKHQKGKVGAKTVKVLFATMLQHQVSEGWLFGLNGFSQDAWRYLSTLHGVNIRMVDGKGICADDPVPYV